MTAVAGLDYSTKRIDVAVVDGRALAWQRAYALGKGVSTTVEAMTRAVRELHAAVGGPCTVYMEQPWMRTEASHGVFALHRIPTRIETLLVAAGFKVVLVPVNTWHSIVLGNGRLSREDAKRASLAVVQREFGVKCANDNESDAVGLALYGRQVQRRDELVALAAKDGA